MEFDQTAGGCKKQREKLKGRGESEKRESG